MSRIFRRIVSFFLGFIMGICSIAGALVGGAYWAYKNVSLEMVGAEQDGLGELNEMTIEEAVGLFTKMSEDPQNYSIKDLEEKYDFDLEKFLSGFGIELKNETADEKANVDAMKEINLAFLFTDGFDAFLDTVSPRVLFNWLPDDLLSYGTRARLAQYSMKDLFNQDSVTGNLGIIDALSAVKFGGLFPSMYTETYDKDKHAYIYTANEGDKAYLDLIGNFNVGSLVSSFTDERTSFLNEFLSGRMTDISQKPLDQLLYELFSAFSADLAETVRDYAKTFGGKSISDLFIYTEDGQYEFSADGLLKEIKLGYLIGLTEKNGEWYDGNEKATGLKSLLANFSIYSLYGAIRSGREDGNMAQAIIDNLCYQFGDLSIGTFLSEFMGYTQDENGKWVAGDGGKTMNLLSALGNISVKGILGGSGTLTENLIKTLKDSFKGYRIGDFISDFVEMERNENGKWIQNGKEVMKVLNGVYEIEINSLIQDEYSLKTVILILKDAVGEVSVGDVMGYTYVNGKWFNGEDEIDSKVALICNVKFSNVLDIFISDFSMTSIVRCLTGELTVGDILETYLDFTYDESEDKYYNSSDKETVPALKELRNVKVWQLVAPFDDSSAYDLFDVLDKIDLGDFIGVYSETDGYWTITLSFLGDDMRVNGAFNKVLDINLGQLLDPDVDANTIVEPLKDCSIGEIVQSILAMYKESGVWKSEYVGNIYNFMEVLAEIPATINDIMDFVGGDITLEQLLKKALGGVEVGNLIGDFIDFEYDNASNEWINASNVDESYKLYQVLLSYRIIDDTYEIINNPDSLDVIKALVGTMEIGHIVEPFTAFTKVSYSWTNDGDEIALILSDVMGVRIAYILSLVQDAINGDEIKATDLIENICGKTRTLGEYVSDFLPDDFSYKPLSVADNLVLYDFVDIVVDGNAEAYGYEDNFEYLNSLFNGLMLGDLFAEFIDYSYDETATCWKDGNSEEIYKIMDALMSVKFTFIFDTVKTVVDGGDLDISDTVEGVLGNNTIKYYTDDFFTSDNTAIDKVLGINIPQFFDIMIEGNAKDHLSSKGVEYTDRIDYLKDIFGELMIGDTFASFVGYEYDSANEMWKDGNAEDVYKILNAIMSVKFSFIFDTVDSAMDGNLDTSDTVEGVLGNNTIKYYTDDFFTSDNTAIDKVLGINIPQFFDIMIEGNAKDHLSSKGVAYEDSIDYLKDIFGELMIGDTFASFVGYEYDSSNEIWLDGNSEELYKILNAIMSVKFGFIFDTVEDAMNGDLDISDTVEGVLGNNTIKYYTDDFFTSDNTAIDKVLGINIPQFFDIMIEGNAKDHLSSKGVAYEDSIDYLKDIFGELMIGDTFASFVGYEYDSANEMWKDGNAEDVYKILNAIMSVKFSFIFDTVDSAMDGNLDISDTVEGVLGNNTIKYYTDDFFTNDNVVLLKALGINIPQFVDIIVEGNAKDHLSSKGVEYTDRIDYLKDIFGEIMVGDTFAQYVDYTYSETAGSWQDASGDDLKRIVNDLLKIKIIYFIEDVMDVVSGDDDVAGLIGGIVDDKTLGYYLEEFIKADKYEPFKYIYDLGIQEFVDVIVCGDAVDNGFTDRADYLEKKFGKLELGELFGQFISLGQNADGDWAKDDGNGKTVKTIVETVMSVNVYETFKFIFGGDYSGDALASYVKQVVGDNETIADLFGDLGMEEDASSRYGYVFKKSGKDIYRVIAELFKINVVELSRDPATYCSDFFGQYEFMDYIAMYGEFFGNYYDKTDKKWYDKDGNPADSGSMALMWTTLGLEGTAAFAVAYFFFNDWLVEQCGDRIYYDLLGEAMGIVYDEANDVYKFDGFEPVSDFWDLLMRTKVGDTMTKGFDFKGYFYDCNVLSVGNLVGYYVNKTAFADYEVTRPAGEWVVVGDYGQTLSALLNFSLKDMVDAKKDGKLSKYFKTLFGKIQLGDFFTQAFGMEISADGWRKKNSESYYKHLFSTIFDINIVDTIDSVKRNTKNGFIYDELYGDIFGRDRTVAYYFADFLDQTYDAEKKVWIDANREVLYSYAQTLYGINLYTFLDDMKDNGAKKAVKNTFGTILIGDLTYDIFAKIKALGLKTEKVEGVYVNSGDYSALMDNIYNISINDITENGKHAKLWKKVFAELYVGDYIAPSLGKLLPKIKCNSDIYYLGKDDGYYVSGEFTKLLTSVFNIYIKDVCDSIKNNEFLKYITSEKALGDVMIADIMFNKGTLIYDSVYDSWRFSDGEIVPFDFSFEALVKQRILKLTIYELTNGFNYWDLINDLYVGHLMSLSRTAELSDSSNIIYTNADQVYTLDESGNKVAFPYELKVDGDGVWYYSKDEGDIVVTMGEHEWFATKTFESYYNVTIEIDADGNATVIDNDNGTSYPTIYDSANDVYSVILPEGEAMFNTYNGIHYVAEPNGEFRRYSQGVLVQRLADIRVLDFLDGIDIYEILSDVYVGEILEYTKGDMSDDLENQYDYTNTYAKYKWYSDEARQERLTAVDELIANICLGSVLDGTIDIYKEAEKLKVKDVFDVDDTPVLNGIREVRINGMTDAIKELYVGEVMEDMKIEVMVDTDGNYLYKSTDPDATYSYYSYEKNSSGVYEYEYVNVLHDEYGYYYSSSFDRVKLTQKYVWAKTNRLLDMRYTITDDKIYKGSEKVGVLVKVSGHDDTFVCDMVSGDKFYAILRDGVYYKAIDENFREKSVTSVENKLICVVADLQLKELNKANFSQNLINKITSGACIGEFFSTEDTGVLSLFTQAELDSIYISEFPTKLKNKFSTSSVGEMLNAGLIEVTADKQTKLNALFGSEWKNYTVNKLVDELLDKVQVTATT